MEIAIVDDMEDDRNLICHLVNTYFEAKKDLYDVSPNFVEFESGEAFLKKYTPGQYELVFLDIYMDKVTGIDVAKQISTLDKNCSIIFFTTSNDHLLDGYDVHAVGYIIKPIENHIAHFYSAMNYVVSKLELDNAGITVSTDFDSIYLYYKNILYIDCNNRTVYVHLTDKVLKILGQYSDYKDNFLSDNRFIECFRSIIVNMDYINAPTNSDFILKSGEKLPISRRKRASVMKKYMMYFIHKQ
ncbi:LytR/AlgR family response regulator transcription factor [Wukongibacter sp. M2B1]|uniref:LytR/AlgR family response regulator transcription factor n=1 Tax=Wukongibacter sp. M2B1 TaxID=3088895 RepID=UPI003D7A4E5E